MKIFITGQKSFAAAVFTMLQAGGHEITGVCCPRTDTDGLEDKLYSLATASGLLPICPKALHAVDIPAGTDLIVCAHNHAYLNQELRNAAKLGAISYHPSLLPRHRGRDAIEWAIRMHDPITGGTVFWVDDGIDTGPIAAQQWCWIEPGKTASDLWREQMFPMGVSLLEQVVEDIDIGISRRDPQNDRAATFEPAINPSRLLRPSAGLQREAKSIT